jgi:hypothetical protein
MGMDVYGKNPASKKGEYFRASVWSWHPLWDYCSHLAPEITEKVKYGHSNDGDGLDEENSIRLGAVLSRAVESGRVEKDATALKMLQDMAPDEPCRICAGTGYRLPVPACGAGDQPCNGCRATGKVRPATTHYTLHADLVAEFAEFLKDCGGFEIN